MAHREDLDILIVEDNPGDVRLVREALKACASSHRLQVARDGEEALAMLRRQPPHQGSSRPNLVLLDLNLPRMDGRELLAQLKHDPELRRIPVVVLTTSGAERDVQSSYDLHANGYVVKPIEVEQLFDMIRVIEQFWFHVARLAEQTQ